MMSSKQVLFHKKIVNTYMLEFKNVSKVYHNKYILKDISFHVEKGEMVVFVGSSGCGKTTTLRMINRLIEPTDGNIFIRGQNSRLMNPIQLRYRASLRPGVK